MLDKMMKSEEGHSESDAKMQVLEELRDMCMGMMGEKVKSRFEPKEEVKSVQVSAPDEESLEQGLDAAKEILPEISASEEMLDDDMSLEEIDALQRELEELRRQKLMKS